MLSSWAAGAIALVTLAGCGSSAGPSGGTGSPDDSPSATPIKVVAAFYPLAYAAEQVGGPAVDVTTLTAPGAEPHDLELTPQQVGEISQADLVLYIPGFQPAVDDAVAQQAADRALDVTADLPLITPSPTPTEATPTEATTTDATPGNSPPPDTTPTDSATAEPQTSPAGDAAELPSDPHVWLDPTLMSAIGDQIAARLEDLNGADQQQVIVGRERLRTAMNALDQRWTAGTRNCVNRDLVVSHEAFGYLARRYDFTQIGISGLSPEAEPSPQVLAEVAAKIRADGITTIYFEALVDPKIAVTLAQETGASTALLDPIEGLKPGSAQDYVSIMDANLMTVQKGQGCT